MEFFGSLFGNKKKSITATNNNNILVMNNLREKIDLLNQRNKYIDGKVSDALLDAKKKMENKDKNAALISLKRKKMFEEEIEKNNGMLLVLENQICTLEGASMNKQLVDAMKLGQSTIKKIHTEMDPTIIEDLMDDINESNENHKTIQNAMAQPLRDMYNDAELLEELEQLENAEEDNDLEKLLNEVKVPKPNEVKVPNEDEDEDEEQELRRMVASLN
jgi:charged multivesicular body protein 4